MPRIVLGRNLKILLWVAASAIVAIVAGRMIYSYRARFRPVVLTGAVVKKDRDPNKQSPVANVKITVVGGTEEENTRSDASGLFRLTLDPLIYFRPVTLRFEHTEYQPQEITASNKDLLYIVRMQPLDRQAVTVPDHVETNAKPVEIGNVRLRYSVKNQTTVEVGSLAKQFEVVNTGDVPCKGKRPCSPDGKWKASSNKFSLDAQKGDEFRNVRVSCISGPCPFTRLEPGNLTSASDRIEVTALDWSDTTSFLVEAEVTRTMTTDMVRQSYPFITGQTMSFALPPTAEGPSVVADMNGEMIVFPLGPNLILSWATCSVEVAQRGDKLYRCESKPGYHLR
jgi:hypothetical protein